MWLIGAALLYAAMVAAALYRAVRQKDWYQNIESDVAPDAPEPPTVAIIVPARNEAGSIERCLAGLLRQHYPADRLGLFAVDDNSTDGTAGIVRRLAAADPRLRLIEAADLPSGWTGKTHACWLGALDAAATAPDWLCFIDADTAAETRLMRCALAFARRRQLDMLSLEPFQELSGFLDRLVIPVGFLAIAATQNLQRVNRPETRDVTANGQFILIRASCYFALGGHSAVRDAICEDSALARRVKGSGHALAVMGAERLIRTRMYDNAAAAWEGLSKNVTEVYGGGVRTVGIALVGVLVGWASLALPMVAAVTAAADPSPAKLAALSLAALTSVAVYGTQIALARHFRIPGWYGLLFTLSCSLGAMIAVNAVIARRRGRVPWKGRLYASPEGIVSGEFGAQGRN